MELTDNHLEAIREAAREVEYGSVTINISATSDTLDIVIQNRIRLYKKPSQTCEKEATLRQKTRNIKGKKQNKKTEEE